jgi:mRNA interferase MazF
MKEGDVVLTPLPQADGQIKNHPAVVLREMPPHGDFLVCASARNCTKKSPASMIRFVPKIATSGVVD